MADIVDTTEHAGLIQHQRAVRAAFAVLDGWAAQVGKPGARWTAEEHARAEELREAARQATAAKEAALHESGLVQRHGYHAASMALKQAAKATEQEASESGAPGQEAAVGGGASD